MNLRGLEYAVAVDEYGSFTRASEVCDVSQPTLSAQVRNLERELGVNMFERNGRSIRTTIEGASLLVYARQVVNTAHELERVAAEGRDPLTGSIRIGIIASLAPYFLPHLLPAIHDRLPRVLPIVVEDLTRNLVERLREGTLEVAILATHEVDAGFVEIPLFEERFYLALAPGHPLADRDTISVTDIDKSTLLLLADGHCLREQTVQLCSESSLGSTTMGDLRASSLETLFNLAEAGYGVTLVPELCLGGQRFTSGALLTRPIADPRAARIIRLVHRRRSPRLAVIESLVDLARTSTPMPLPA